MFLLLHHSVTNYRNTFVCFKSGMGTGACLGSPIYLRNMSIFAEIPQSREFPLHHYSGLGTRTIRQTSGTQCRKNTLPKHKMSADFLLLLSQFEKRRERLAYSVFKSQQQQQKTWADIWCWVVFFSHSLMRRKKHNF